MKSKKGSSLTSVALYLSGSELNTAFVSQVIGAKPSASQKKGDLRPGSSKRIAKTGVWMIEVKDESRSALELVDELLQTIGRPPVRLDNIEGVEDAHLDIFVALDDEGERSSTSTVKLTAKQMKRLSQLGLYLCITLYL